LPARLRARRDVFSGLGFALTFLTIVPLRLRHAASPSAGARWFPLVGAAVGAAAGGVFWAARGPLGSGPAAVVATAILVVATGGIHLDGLADSADGLGSRGDRAHRLEVMRDPRLGTFGALALGVWLLLMATALPRLAGLDALRTLIAAGAVSRWSAVLHATLAPPARPDGLGAAFQVDRASVVVGSVSAAAVVFAASDAADGAIAALVIAMAVALGSTAWAHRALGGRTGDTLGATVALTEALAVVALGAIAGS
jgi:adenosylcobinamide-GDP ribazoletransferase